MHKYRVAAVFTLIGFILCFLHFFGYDPKNMLLFSFSVPLWFMPIFGDIRTFNLFAVYFVTILSWTIMGYVVDRFVLASRRKRQEES
jgi:hypothetical protein